MNYEKYTSENDICKLIIEEDAIGACLIIFEKPELNKSTSDYLLDTLEEAFQEAYFRFGITKDQWTKQKS